MELPASLIAHRELVGRLTWMRDRDWQVVLMRAQGATYTQIAQATGLSIEGARQILHRISWRYGFRFPEEERLPIVIREAFL